LFLIFLYGCADSGAFDENICRDAAVKYTKEQKGFDIKGVFALGKWETLIITTNSKVISVKSTGFTYPFVSEYKILGQLSDSLSSNTNINYK
jgi:hypothetical protein